MARPRLCCPPAAGNEYRLFVVNSTPDFDPDSEAERVQLAKVLARKRRKLQLLESEDFAGDPSNPHAAAQYPNSAPLLQNGH
mmetsp:Transcript_63893/g.175395  ORF Transcript_63893/g.175395 Transcript_63893/m.175395 type:complete len:82 (-) Transcript_63893:409-654(-)